MHDKQEINLLLEMEANSGILKNVKIIRNIKDFIKKSSVSLVKFEDDSSDRTGSCSFCTTDYEIFVYRYDDEVPTETFESESKVDVSEILELDIKKEEIFVEPIVPPKINEEEVAVACVAEKNEEKPVVKKRMRGPGKNNKGRKKRVLQIHSLQKTEDGYYKCDVCNSEFHSAKSLYNHRSFCTGNYLGRYKAGPNPKCSYCDKTFASWSSCRAHEAKIHTKTMKFVCEVCGFTSNNKETFESHQQRDHKEGKHIVCDICQYRCSYKSGMRSHMKLKHLNIDTHVCEICAKTFGNTHLLQKHFLHKHCDVRNFPCSLCNKAFKTERTLKDHSYKIHTPVELKQKFACELCGFTSTSKFSFTQHQGTHLDKDECPYKCSVCGRGFASKYRYKDHQQVHMVERPFPCLFCEKTFKRKADLKIHTRYHTGEQPYECEICKKRYSDRGCYRSHLVVHEKQLGVILDKSVKKFLETPKTVPLEKNLNDN